MINIVDLMAHWNNSYEIQAQYSSVADYIDAVQNSIKNPLNWERILSAIEIEQAIAIK